MHNSSFKGWIGCLYQLLPSYLGACLYKAAYTDFHAHVYSGIFLKLGHFPPFLKLLESQALVAQQQGSEHLNKIFLHCCSVLSGLTRKINSLWKKFICHSCRTIYCPDTAWTCMLSFKLESAITLLTAVQPSDLPGPCWVKRDCL